jgi:phosphoglycolate phosphatase
MVVFDLDGTLVDSAPDLVDSLNVILGREGLAPLPLEVGRKFVGAGGRVLIRRGLAAAGREVADSRLEAMFAAFLAHYEDNLSARTVFYPGVEAALERLAASGHALAICTNKFERPARKLLRELGWEGRFGAIVGQDTFPVSKPNGAVLKLTIEKAGGHPARAIMVGDTVTDISAARDAGLPVIAVDFGYAPVPVADLNPDRIISHFNVLPEIVEDLWTEFFQAGLV